MLVASPRVSDMTLVASQINPRPNLVRCLALPSTPTHNGQKSIMDFFYAMGGNKSGRSILKSVDLLPFKHELVRFLSAEYNGDRVFELPTLAVVKEGGLSRLDGTDQKRNGHVWTKTATSNISDPSGVLSFKYLKCLGHLRCVNPDCHCIY